MEYVPYVPFETMRDDFESVDTLFAFLHEFDNAFSFSAGPHGPFELNIERIEHIDEANRFVNRWCEFAKHTGLEFLCPIKFPREFPVPAKKHVAYGVLLRPMVRVTQTSCSQTMED